MTFYRRNLPHWHPDGKALFITWRLYGSLPRKPEAKPQSSVEVSPAEEFKKVDKILDRADSGPVWLKNPQVASCVIEILQRGSSGVCHYDLHAYVVMLNHIHVLLTPKIEPRKLMKSLKGVTAREANRLLCRTGKPFWQDESFDRWLRNEAEFASIRNYIEHNPVSAGLVERPEDWPWSSATQRS